MTDTKAAEEQLRWQIEGRNDHNSRRIRLILQALTEECQRVEDHQRAWLKLWNEAQVLKADLAEERRKRERITRHLQERLDAVAAEGRRNFEEERRKREEAERDLSDSEDVNSRLTERLEQFAAYGMPTVADALEKINAAERDAKEKMARLYREVDIADAKVMQENARAEKAERDAAVLRRLEEWAGGYGPKMKLRDKVYNLIEEFRDWV